MVSGSFYTIAVSLLVLIVDRVKACGSLSDAVGNLCWLGGPHSVLFHVNLLLLAVVTWGTHVRVKEAMTVFSAYGIVMTKELDGADRSAGSSP